VTKCILYGDLSDADLDAKILELRIAYETAVGGKVATVIAGEGRRIEYTRANLEGLKGLLTSATRERDRRAGVQTSGAIRVTFPYGGDFYNG
jgi:hypothetical protein